MIKCLFCDEGIILATRIGRTSRFAICCNNCNYHALIKFNHRKHDSKNGHYSRLNGHVLLSRTQQFIKNVAPHWAGLEEHYLQELEQKWE